MPPVESKKRNSILGSLALLLAAPAVALNYFDFSGLPTVQAGPFTLRFPIAIAAGVTTVAFLSLFLAGRSRRTGTEIPLAALLVGAAGLGLGYFRHRPAPPAAAPSPAPTASDVKPVTPPPAVGAQKKPPKTQQGPNPSNLANQGKSAVNNATDAALRQRNLVLLRQAQSDYDAARDRVTQSLEADPAYTAAKTDADTTMADLKRARIDSAPGSPALITAGQKALAAREKLQIIIESAIAKDLDASRAKDQLESVKASMQRPAGAKP